MRTHFQPIYPTQRIQQILQSQCFVQTPQIQNLQYVPQNIIKLPYYSSQQPLIQQHQSSTLKYNKIEGNQNPVPLIQKSQNQQQYPQQDKNYHYKQSNELQKIQDQSLYQQNQDEHSQKGEELNRKSVQINDFLQKQEITPTQVAKHLQNLVIHQEDGHIYKGEGYEPSTKEGQGILTYLDGKVVYDGQWRKDKYHGRGKLYNLKMEEIFGPFDYTQLKMDIIQNGWTEYEGNFEEGQMHDQGILKLSNEEYFEGFFKMGIIDGNGIFTTMNGQKLKGIWKQGSLDQILD